MTFDDFENFLLTEECFNKHDVSVIDKDGLQHYLNTNNENYVAYLAAISLEIGVLAKTIKVEQFEKALDVNDGTVHVFYNQKNGPSFDVHTDPIDVIIECVEGTKIMEVEGKEISLSKNETLFIEAGTPHRALNYEKALMLSHGIHDSETINSIR